MTLIFPPVHPRTGGGPPHNQALLTPDGRAIAIRGLGPQIKYDGENKFIVVMSPKKFPREQGFRRCDVQVDGGTHGYCDRLVQWISGNSLDAVIAPPYEQLRVEDQLQSKGHKNIAAELEALLAA